MTLRMRSAFALLLLILTNPGFSADGFDAYMNEFRRSRDDTQQKFESYRKQQDEDFARYLGGAWRDFEAGAQLQRMRAPEPVRAPIYSPDQPRTNKEQADTRPAPPPVVPAVTPAVPATPSITLPAIDSAVVNQATQKPPLAMPDAGWIMLGFFGNDLRIPYETLWRQYRLPEGDKPAAIRDFWTYMSASRYQPLVDSMAEIRKRLQLDDWATIQLWQRFAQQAIPDNKPVADLSLWFFLVKAGLDTRIAYTGEEIHVLVGVKQTVYDSPQFRFDGKTYYPILAPQFGKGIRSFYSYDAKYPEPLRLLDMGSIDVDFAKPVLAKRKLSFTFEGRPIDVSAIYNAGVIPYLDTVPPLDFEIYFSSSASRPLRDHLLPQLKTLTKSMPEDMAVQFLLSLVQHAFDYKTNAEQFGREKSFFVDDAFYFPYSDCKARAVLFTWLVRNVLGLHTVGLHYDNHLSTAVAMKTRRPDWAVITHKGTSYVYADPTYIGAPVGKQQREYQNRKPIRVVSF